MLFAALMISCVLSCCLNGAEGLRERNNVERMACFTDHVPTKLRKYTYKIQPKKSTEHKTIINQYLFKIYFLEVKAQE